MNCLIKTLFLGVFFSSGLCAETLGDFSYYISAENEVTITDYTGPGGDIEIPAEIDGFPVVTIGNNAFAKSSGLTSVTIPIGVTSIGSNCFTACYSLSEVNLPDGLVTIGNDAFRLCEALEEIVLPDSVTTVRSRAFIWCKNLTKVTLSDNLVKLPGQTFYGCERLNEVNFGNNLQSLYSGVFEKCTSLTSVSIPASVLYFDQPVFRGCSNLTRIDFSPGNENFFSLDGVVLSKDLKTLIACPSGITGTYIIPEGVEELGSGVFAYCDKITELVIPESLQSIDKANVRSCSNLERLTLAGEHLTVASQDGVLFSKDLKEIQMFPPGREGDYVIPEGVQVIGRQAFADCTRLTGIFIPNTVSTIENSAFSNCSGLATVTIPDSVLSISYGAFSYCYALQEIDFGNSLQSIGGAAFKFCFELARVSIPDSVTSLGESAFFDCIGLLEIHFGRGLTEIPEEAFASCNSLTNVFIPEGITRIGNGAFSYCTNLIEVIIPNGVTELMTNAFGSCIHLTTILIPASVTSMSSTFTDCLELSAVYFLGDPPQSVNDSFVNTSEDLVVYYLDGNTAWGDTFEDVPIMTFEPFVTIYPSDESFQIEFLGGVLEKSTDLIHWTTVLPQPVQANLTTGQGNGMELGSVQGRGEAYRVRTP